MSEYEANLLNQPVDVSEKFAEQQNYFFIGSNVPYLDPRARGGHLRAEGKSPARQGKVDRARREA